MGRRASDHYNKDGSVNKGKQGKPGHDHKQPYTGVSDSTDAKINASTKKPNLMESVNKEISSIMDSIVDPATGDHPTKEQQQMILQTAKGDKSSGQKSGPGHRIHNAYDDVKDTASGLYHDITDPVTDALDDVNDVFQEAQDAVSDAISGVENAVDEIGEKAQGLFNDIKGVPRVLENTWDNIKVKSGKAAHTVAKDAEKVLLAVAIIGVVFWKATAKQRPAVRNYLVEGGKTLGKRALQEAPKLLAFV